jgi:hypothetical protein
MHQSYVVQATVPPEHGEKADLKHWGYTLNILQLLDSHGARHYKSTVVVTRPEPDDLFVFDMRNTLVVIKAPCRLGELAQGGPCSTYFYVPKQDIS